MQELTTAKIYKTKATKTLTAAGTAPAANWAGMSFGWENTFNLLSTVPDAILIKKTFQMVKNNTLQQAPLFLALREIDPSIVEKRIINGGTV